MTICAPLSTSPNNVEGRSSVSKPKLQHYTGGRGERGARQEYFWNDANGMRFEQSVPRLMARVVGINQLGFMPNSVFGSTTLTAKCASKSVIGGTKKNWFSFNSDSRQVCLWWEKVQAVLLSNPTRQHTTWVRFRSCRIINKIDCNSFDSGCRWVAQ